MLSARVGCSFPGAGKMFPLSARVCCTVEFSRRRENVSSLRTRVWAVGRPYRLNFPFREVTTDPARSSLLQVGENISREIFPKGSNVPCLLEPVAGGSNVTRVLHLTALNGPCSLESVATTELLKSLRVETFSQRALPPRTCCDHERFIRRRINSTRNAACLLESVATRNSLLTVNSEPVATERAPLGPVAGGSLITVLSDFRRLQHSVPARACCSLRKKGNLRIP
jgi:hypothetical protein